MLHNFFILGHLEILSRILLRKSKLILANFISKEHILECCVNTHPFVPKINKALLSNVSEFSVIIILQVFMPLSQSYVDENHCELADVIGVRTNVIVVKSCSANA
jgi:hypothetical protein